MPVSLNKNQGRHTRCGRYGEHRTTFKSGTFAIDFQISGALSHNAKMKWTETAKNNANLCVVQRIRMLPPAIERLMV